MTRENIRLRAHHGLCLAFFEGKGYDDVFAAHMAMILRQTEENPSLEIIADADILCGKCPNLENGICRTSSQVREYDRKTLLFCGLSENIITDWDSFSALVSEKILRQGKRREICGDCEWNDICSAREKEWVK